MRKHMCVLIAAAAMALIAAPAARADEHFRGCLVGTHDNYVLRTESGELYRLHSHSQDDMKSHLGMTVDIKGHISDHERERESRQQAAAQDSARVEIPKHGINVSEIKGLSPGCAEVKNGVAVFVPVPVPVAPSQTTTTTTPSQTTTTTTTTGTALPQGAIVLDNDSTATQHMVGCLVGTEDFYVLKGDDGTLYRLRSDADLREHVGETVAVSGRIDNTKREIEAQHQAELANRMGVQIPQVGINVASLKTIAKGCSAAPRP